MERFTQSAFICWLLFLLPVLCSSQNSPTASAIKRLRSLYPEVAWDESTARVGDVICDGSADVIVVGEERNRIWVAVVPPPKGTTSKPLTSSYPVGTQSQDSFCAVPKRVDVYPLDCRPEGESLPGCRPVKSCKGFAVPDDECDSFNFYWDSSKKMLRWWRN